MGELINSLHPAWGAVIIMAAKIIELSISSIKTVFMAKGNRSLASTFGFIECLVWGFVVSAVITSLSENLLWLFAYAIGYSLGVFLGMKIESKIAIGTKKIELIANEKNTEIVTDYLAEHNRGFTVVTGHGKEEIMNIITIVLPRKVEKETIKKINELTDNKCFVNTSDVSRMSGGYGVRK